MEGLARRFDMAIGLIAPGLVRRKERMARRQDRSAPGYCQEPALRKGCEIFLALWYSDGGGREEIFRYAHEQAFHERFITLPVEEWAESWPEEAKHILELKSHCYVSGNTLGRRAGSNAFLATADCHALLNYWANDHCETFTLLMSMQQRRVYDALKDLHAIAPDLYAKGRSLIIDNPIITDRSHEDRMRSTFLGKGSDACRAADILFREAYEPLSGMHGSFFACPGCGWTITGRDGYTECSDSSCAKHFGSSKLVPIEAGTEYPERLRPGVMNYIGLPGKLELAIQKYAQKPGLPCEMYPERDTFDAGITLPDGRVLMVDAKRYKSPAALYQNISETGGAPLLKSGRYGRAIFVLPSGSFSQSQLRAEITDRLRQDPRIRNSEAIECMTLRSFRMYLRKEAENAKFILSQSTGES